MKTAFYKFFFIVFGCFFIQTIHAQDPNWSVNSASYQYSMTFTAFLNLNGTTLTASNDKVAAFVNGEIRGVANVSFVASANKYVAYLSVYANTSQETIDFKIYNSATDAVIAIDKTATFVIDGNLGGIAQSYAIASPILNKNAVMNSFNFDGISSVVSNISSDKITIVLPENTNLSALRANFDTSSNASVFVNNMLQISASSVNDYTNSIVYKVVSENEANTTTYEVLVSSALNNNPTTAVISSAENLKTNTSPVSLDIVFSKVVLGFDISDFILENAVVTSLSTSDSQNYKVDIIPFSQGDFSAQIPASISLDANNNLNEISNKIGGTYDISKPVISSISSETTLNSWSFLVTFSEDVLNVDLTDFELTGSASEGLFISDVLLVNNKQYKVTIANGNSAIGVVSLKLKNTSDISDIARNTIVNQQFEAYFLNNEVLQTEDFQFKKSVHIFPNPTKRFIQIQLKNQPIEALVIYDINGKKVFSRKVKTQEIIIDIQKLKAGVYFLQTHSTRGVSIQKIIKN